MPRRLFPLILVALLGCGPLSPAGPPRFDPAAFAEVASRYDNQVVELDGQACMEYAPDQGAFRYVFQTPPPSMVTAEAFHSAEPPTDADVKALAAYQWGGRQPAQHVIIRGRCKSVPADHLTALYGIEVISAR